MTPRRSRPWMTSSMPSMSKAAIRPLLDRSAGEMNHHRPWDDHEKEKAQAGGENILRQGIHRQAHGDGGDEPDDAHPAKPCAPPQSEDHEPGGALQDEDGAGVD